MNILLIQLKMGHGRELIYPIGLSCIAKALHDNGHVVNTLDMNTELDSFSLIEKILTTNEINVIGISIRNTDYPEESDILHQISKLISSIKKISGNNVVIAGGTGFSIFAEKIIDNVHGIDFGVFLEGEKTIIDLLGNLDHPEKVKGILYRNKNGVVFTPPRSLDNLADYKSSWDYFKLEKYTYIGERENLFGVGLESKRGCVFSCAYCLYPYLSGYKIRTRDPSKVVDDIEYLEHVKKMKFFVFTDPVFNAPKENSIEICREIIKRNLTIKWSAWFDIRNISEELMQVAVKANCIEFAFSPDGYSNTTLAMLKKKITTKDIHKTVELARKITGTNVSYNFFLFPPGQTLIGICRMILFRIFVKMILGKKLKGCGFSVINLMPNTTLYKIALQEELITKDIDLMIQKISYSPPKLKIAADFYNFIWKMKQKKFKKDKTERFI